MIAFIPPIKHLHFPPSANLIYFACLQVGASSSAETRASLSRVAPRGPPLFPGYSSSSTIVHSRTCTSSFCRSPVLAYSRLAMAQFASGPLASVAPEEFSTLVTPTAVASPSFHAFHFRLHDDPLYTTGEPQVVAGLEPVIDSIAVTATRAPDTSPPTPSSGFPVSGT